MPRCRLYRSSRSWIIENEWHWRRDTQLHEDANHKGAPLFAFLRTVLMQTQSAGALAAAQRRLEFS